MGVEVSGLFALLVLIGDIWAIVNLFQSRTSPGKIVFWILLILVLPVLGFIIWFLGGPKSVRK